MNWVLIPMNTQDILGRWIDLEVDILRLQLWKRDEEPLMRGVSGLLA